MKAYVTENFEKKFLVNLKLCIVCFSLFIVILNANYLKINVIYLFKKKLIQYDNY